MNNKGQMFIIISVIVIMILIGIKLVSNIPEISESERQLEGNFEDRFFVNIGNELDEVIRISIYEDIPLNVYDFCNFTDDKMKERAMTFKTLFVGFEANHTTGQINITLINHMDRDITDTTVTINGNIFQEDLSDKELWTTNCSYTPGTEYRVFVTYDGSDYNQTILLDTSNSKDQYFGFYDLTLTGSYTEYKTKFLNDYNLS